MLKEESVKPVALKSSKQEKKKETKTVVSKKTILHRVSSSGKISKRTKFGMNKGVQHAIRKPVFKKLKKKKFAEKKKEEKVKAFVEKKQKKKQEEEKEDDSDVEAGPRVAKVLPAPKAKSPNVYKPKKSGKLKVAQSSPNVSYEIRNGFPVFR